MELLKKLIKYSICCLKGHDWDKQSAFPKYFEICMRCGETHDWA